MTWPRCREVSRGLAEGAYEGAPWASRVLLRLHLLICAGCRAFKAQLELLGDAFRSTWAAGPDPAKVAALERGLLDRLK